MATDGWKSRTALILALLGIPALAGVIISRPSKATSVASAPEDPARVTVNQQASVIPDIGTCSPPTKPCTLASGCPGVQICVNGVYSACRCLGGGGTASCSVDGYPGTEACSSTCVPGACNSQGAAIEAWRAIFPLPSGVPAESLGFNTGLAVPYALQCSEFQALGVKWVRINFQWADIEGPNAGQYTFSTYASFVQAMSNCGIRIVGILGSGPGGELQNTYGEVKGPPTASTTPTQITAFTNYAIATMSNFRDAGVLWEMWNEPNANTFWSGSAAQYVALANAVGVSVRANLPEQYFVAPALAHFEEMANQTVLEGYFNDGLMDWLDAVTVHHYYDGSPPEQISPSWTWLQTLIPKYVSEEPFPIAAYETETGYCTPHATLNGSASEILKAAWIARAWLANIASGVPLTMIYDFDDDPYDANICINSPGQPPNASFGVAEDAGAELLPAYYALQFVADRLPYFTYTSGNIANANDSTVVVENFVNNNNGSCEAFVASDTNVPRSIPISVPDGTWYVDTLNLTTSPPTVTTQTLVSVPETLNSVTVTIDSTPIALRSDGPLCQP